MELGEVARLGTIVAMTVLARPERERVGPPEAMAANAPHVGAAAVLVDKAFAPGAVFPFHQHRLLGLQLAPEPLFLVDR